MPGQDGKGVENSEYSCTDVTERVTNLFNSEAIVEALTCSQQCEGKNINSNVKHVQMSNNTLSSLLSCHPSIFPIFFLLPLLFL